MLDRVDTQRLAGFQDRERPYVLGFVLENARTVRDVVFTLLVVVIDRADIDLFFTF